LIAIKNRSGHICFEEGHSGERVGSMLSNLACYC